MKHQNLLFVQRLRQLATMGYSKVKNLTVHELNKKKVLKGRQKIIKPQQSILV